MAKQAGKNQSDRTSHSATTGGAPTNPQKRLTSLRSRLIQKRIIIPFIIALVLVSGYTYTTASAQGFRNAIKLATTHQPERLTELYFTNYQSIEKEAKINTPYTISFTTVNHEAMRMNYPYQVLQVVNGTATKIAGGTFTLNDTQSKDTPFTVTFTQPDTTYQIVIQLPSVNQEINVRIKT